MDDPLWYKNAILYELHVRSFCDSNGDGIGDFRGLRQKLGYLQDLGVTALWLLPFYPSPLKDDGYDIADYRGIHPAYGTLSDFKVFLKEAHRRGLKVITELVLNHTSDRHPWFQKARRARPGSAARDFYVWSSTPDRYRDARIIFKDFEKSNWAWDSIAKAYYWHRFYSHQPDLNYDNPKVRQAILEVTDYWLEMGVDGMRLDAVPYLVEREGTNCENLDGSHAFLKELRSHVEGRFKNRMLLAEANQWPEEARAYFGEGDECHMAFHFPLMPRMFMSIRMEDRFPLMDILQRTPSIPENCQWALFLRNHDELTLEMVTDEERDYLWRAYAQDPQARINLGIRRRLSPLLGNNRRKIDLMNGLLFSLPGSPVIYYGDELGMGDNVALADRNGVRTPMQWDAGKNAGFSKARPGQLVVPVITEPEYHYESVNVAVQDKNPHSLLWQMRRLINLRKEHPAFGQGTLEFLHPPNPKILAFLRSFKEETVLVVANLSRFVQFTEMDLSAFKGRIPVEMFGATRFPAIGEKPYFVTIGPHTFYWFTLESDTSRPGADPARKWAPPVLEIREKWEELVAGKDRAVLEAVLADYLQTQRWFAAKARVIRSARIVESIGIPWNSETAFWTLVEIRYREGEPEMYALPLLFVPQGGGETPPGAIAQVKISAGQRLGQEEAPPRPSGQPGEAGFLCDAPAHPSFCAALLPIMARKRRFRGEQGELAAGADSLLREWQEGREGKAAQPALLNAEQSNTSVVYGEEWVLKLFRRVEAGIHPDLEIGRFLTEKSAFRNFARVGGSLEYRSPGRSPMTLGILQRYIPNEGDAWSHTLDVVGRFFEEMLARGTAAPSAAGSLIERAGSEIPASVEGLIGPFLELAKLLGKRTAEMHAALAENNSDPAFRPEPFTDFYQRSMYERLRNGAIQSMGLLREWLQQAEAAPGVSAHRLAELPTPDIRLEAETVLGREKEMFAVFQKLLRRGIGGSRIRCHGDYHLGQVLYTGNDFFIIDFEGEPARSLGERRTKRSPLRDVAGMIRSFHYAAYAVLFARDAGNPIRPEDLKRLEGWGKFWRSWVSAAFLRVYLQHPESTELLPKSSEERALLLRAYLLEKALYELRYEMNNRPGWVRVPLRGILHLTEKEA